MTSAVSARTEWPRRVDVAERVGEEGLPDADQAHDCGVVVRLDEASEASSLRRARSSSILAVASQRSSWESGWRCARCAPERGGLAVAPRVLVAEGEQLLAGEGEALGQGVAHARKLQRP
jgi:hypothetical protein